MQQDATGSEEGINNLNKSKRQIYHGTDGFESFRPRSVTRSKAGYLVQYILYDLPKSCLQLISSLNWLTDRIDLLY